MVESPVLNHLLFLLPGQSLSPRAFWGFEIDGKSHADYFKENGIDVYFFEPAGYGDNKEFYSYNRVGYADQIEKAVKSLGEYKSKTILGFSTSTAPALIAGERGLFDNIIIHSPSLRKHNKYFVKHGLEFKTGIERLKAERLSKISDKLIPKPNRIDGWEDKLIKTIGKTEWKVPASVVNDINNYYPLNGKYGFNPNNIPPILSIIGEYDYECTTGGYDLFKTEFPNLKEVIIPNSTHFSMWENNYKITLQTVRDFVKSSCL